MYDITRITQLRAMTTDCTSVNNPTKCPFVTFNKLKYSGFDNKYYGAGTCNNANCVSIFLLNDDYTSAINCAPVPIIYMWPSKNGQTFTVFDLKPPVTLTDTLKIGMRKNSGSFGSLRYIEM
jgi:hypothetical protein